MEENVKRSSSKVVTTHVGSLPYLAPLDKNSPNYEKTMREQVAAVVKKQRELGLDIINEGEYAKGGSQPTVAEDIGGEDRGRTALETEFVHSGSPASRSAPVNAAASGGTQPTLANCLLILNEGCRARTRAAAALVSKVLQLVG